MSARAKISDRTRETHQQRGFAPPSWAGDAALAEARAILAETESKCVPDRPSMFPQDRGICCAVNEATDALAESLRSFVEA